MKGFLPSFVAAAAWACASAAALAAQSPVPTFPITAIGPAFDPAKPTVVVIDAGGTLTARARDGVSYQHYQGSVEGGVQTILQDLYPELGPIANLSVVRAEGFSLGGSSAVTTESLYNVSRTIDAQSGEVGG